MCNVYIVEVFLSHDSKVFSFFFSIHQIWFTCMKSNTFCLTVKVPVEVQILKICFTLPNYFVNNATEMTITYKASNTFKAQKYLVNG